MTKKSPFEAIRSVMETKTGKMGASTLIVLGALGLAGCGQNVEAKPSSTPTSVASPEATTNPDVWYEKINTNPTEKDIEISAETIKTDDIGVAFAEKVTMWYNSGYSPEWGEHAVDSGWGPAAEKKAAEYDQLFIDSLLVKGWETRSDQSTKELIGNIKQNHLNSLSLAALTSLPDINPDDKEPYMRGRTVVETVNTTVNEDGSITVITIENDYDNASMNRAGEKLTGGTAADSSIKVKIQSTYVIEDGIYKLLNSTVID